MVNSALSSEAGDAQPHDPRWGPGPVLLLHSPGRLCSAIAEKIVKQLDRQNMTCDVDLITHAHRFRDILAAYHLLIVVLPATDRTHQLPDDPLQPDPTGDMLGQLRIVAGLVHDYRGVHPRGLAHLRADAQPRYTHAGVIQFVGLQGVVKHEALEKALARVCWWHYTDLDEAPVDVFAPYLADPGQPPPLTGTCAPDIAGRSIAAVCTRIADWQIHDIQLVSRLRERIEQQRLVYEDDRYHRLHRPVSGYARNRLDFVLDDPRFVPPEFAGIPESRRGRHLRNWTADGARVQRHTLSALKSIAPELARPRGRTNTKGAQFALADLYADLCTLHEYLIDTPPEEWPTLR
jgi:hypothetical protein